MGCDWIDAGEVCFGYELSYWGVFRNTKYANVEYLRYGDEEDEDEEDEDEEGEDEEDEDSADGDVEVAEVNKQTVEQASKLEKYQTAGSYAPANALISAWYHYLEKYHHELLKFKVQVFIGCNSMPGSYEREIQTGSCSVIFGFSKFDFASKKKKGSVSYSAKAFEFPDSMPSVVDAFLADFQKLPKSTAKKAKQEVESCPLEPVMKSFVG